MRDFFLRLWYKITCQSKILVEDRRLEKPAKKWIPSIEISNWLRDTNKQYQDELSARRGREIDFVWCLVGNIVQKHSTGERKEIRTGSKHFSTGTKVYCFPPKWGDGYERIYVIGRPRRTSRFIKVIIKSNLVTNWRIQKVFSPHIKREMIRNDGWDNTDESKDRLNLLLNSILENRVENKIE